MKRTDRCQTSKFALQPDATDWGAKTFAQLVARQKEGLPLLNSHEFNISKLLEVLEYPSPYKEERLVDLILSKSSDDARKLIELEQFN